VLSSSKEISREERNRRHHSVSLNREGVIANLFGQLHEFLAVLARLQHVCREQIGIP